MSTTIYVSADSLKPSDHTVEQAYYYGDGSSVPFGPPVLIDSGDGQEETLLPAGNTQSVFVYGGNLYKLLNRQQVFATVICKSTDGGATWTVLDSANSPLFETCSGFFDETNGLVICAYVDANGAAGNIRLRNFNLATGLWEVVNPHVGPATGQAASIAVFQRTDNTVIVLFQNRNSFNPGDPSGLAAVVYDPVATSWGSTFDVGAALLLLPGWDATQTIVNMSNVRVTMDSATGVIHSFFSTSSIQTVPVVWGNRVFYQAIKLDNSLGSFNDFPGQVAPFPAPPYNKQQLEAFSGPPFGNPLIIGSNILLPVSQRNDSLIDRFPFQLPNLYIGTPLAAPMWTLQPGTIDPGPLADDFIWIQQAPSITYDGTTVSVVYSAQDEDGQNLARLRMTQTTDTTTYAAASWTGQTIFDLQVDAPVGFNFPTQFLSGAGAFSPLASPPPPVTLSYSMINARGLCLVPLPDPKKCR